MSRALALVPLGLAALVGVGAAEPLAQPPSKPPASAAAEAQAAVGAAATATSSAPEGSAPNDYAADSSWLCRPGRHDACAVDLDATVVAADGTLTLEHWAPDPEAPIDCFYVYPTVSLDPGPISDLTPGVGELAVARVQLARFGSKCRLYAPLYRQYTLTAIADRSSGTRSEGRSSGFGDRGVGYNDVVDAWKHYLEHDNQGRGVVLIGHSQGSAVLTGLIRNEIEGKKVEQRVVSALLLGTNIGVPRGADVGGTFEHMPLCRSASQTGCIVTYSTFRSTAPPPPLSLFGRVRLRPGQVAACTNPAALGGGSAELHSYLSARGRTGEAIPFTVPPKPIDTAFVTVPGLLRGECVEKGGASYLEVTVMADPGDARVDDIQGDVVIAGEVRPGWGLHLIDMAVAMGDLVDLVGRQAKAYLEAR